MDLMLRYKCDQSDAHALNICRYPADFRENRKLRITALRYLFQYKTRGFSQDELERITISLFNEYKTNRAYREYIYELADIYHNFASPDKRDDLLIMLREIDERDEHDEHDEHDEREEKKGIRHVPTHNPPQVDLYGNAAHVIEPYVRPVPKPLPEVYKDSQNVHNSAINKSVINALKFLFAKYKNKLRIQGMTKYENIQKVSDMVSHVFGSEDCKDDSVKRLVLPYTPDWENNMILLQNSEKYIVTSVAIFDTEEEINLRDAFLCVWFWIQDYLKKVRVGSNIITTDELNIIERNLITRLLEELREMKGLCSTGHIARLMNVIQGYTEESELQIRISNRDQCRSVINNYLTTKLANAPEDIQEGMIDTESKDVRDRYITYIRNSVAEKLLGWKEEYGADFLEEIASIVNDFSGTTIFVLNDKDKNRNG